jgi:hypothetical protein
LKELKKQNMKSFCFFYLKDVCAEFTETSLLL